MTEHERSLALAAAAIDFPLSPAESAALAAHLAACPACSRAAARLRDDAASLTALERPPAPAHVRRAVVRAATGGPAPMTRPAGLRWSFVAALLALLAVGGTFVTGAVLDRLREPRPLPTDPGIVVRPTLAPQPTAAQAPDATPAGPTGFEDLGVVVSAFDGRTVQLVLPRPGGGLVAIGRDQVSTLPAVWTSVDGSSWTTTDQPEDVFGWRVPTGGVLHGGLLWAVGWDISTQSAQRAIWSSDDGVTWSRAGGSGGLLGTEASALQIAAGPAGLLVWAPDGRAWTSADGTRWVRSDAGVGGVTDAAVDDAFHLVGVDGSRAFLVTSTDGRAWSSPSRQPAGADTRVGIERAGDGTLLAWVGDQAYQVSADGWHKASGAPAVPSGEVMGGEQGLVVVATPTTAGVQRAWVGDGQAAWGDRRSDPASSGGRTVVAIAPLGDGWYLLTRQGTTYRGWLVS